jgi:tRNA pseudouridine55 synthase
MKKRQPELDGFLNVDKPPGITSRAVVDRVCRMVNSKRVGHAGTLDPLATGVLVIAIGKATRLVEYVQNQRKTYQAGFLLGQTSDTDDTEGTIRFNERAASPQKNEIESALENFTGRIEQIPPKFSAIKLEGKRAYDLARAGAEVKLRPRPVEVFRINVEEYSFPKLSLKIECGSGTYIRSIARDLGELLGVGGLMESLTRTAIGIFQQTNAVSLERLEQEDWRTHLRPLVDGCAGMRVVELGDEQRDCFVAGRAFPMIPPHPGNIAVLYNGAFLGIAAGDVPAGLLRPVKAGFEPGR